MPNPRKIADGESMPTGGPTLKLISCQPTHSGTVPFGDRGQLRVTIWTNDEWAALPAADRPGHAQPTDDGAFYFAHELNGT